MNPRKRPPPRNEVLDWRDPEMKVLVKWRGSRGVQAFITPQEWQAAAKHSMKTDKRPLWRNDPTY